MAVSDTITSITGHLTDDYKALEQLGVSVEDRNIENIKDMANQIYAKFPKTSYAEGSNITLSNCLKGKLDYEDGKVGYGDTKQESTKGYQLFNNDNISTGYNVNSLSKIDTGVKRTMATAGSGIAFSVVPVLDVTNYVGQTFILKALFRASGNNTGRLCLGLCNSTGGGRVVGEGAIDVSGDSITYTIPTITGDSKYLAIWFYGNYNGTVQANDYVDFTNVMLELGSTAHEWEKYTGGISAPNPSYPQPIQVVTGEQEVVVRGKNLFDDINFVYGFVNSSGVISITTTSKINAMSDYIPCLPNTSYVASSSEQIYGIGIAEFDENKTYIKRYSRQNVSTSAITTTNETKYLIVWYNYDNTTNMTTQLIKNKEIQFEQSDQATTYEPYITPITKQLSLGNIELCKIGTYRDYIYKNNGKWYKLGKIKKLTMNGNEEGWQYSNSTLINTKIEDYFKTTDNVLTCYLNYYKSVAQVSSANNLTNNYIATFGNNASNYRLYIKDNNFSTINPYKEWLSTHNLIVYYVLATPTDTEITDTTLVTQLEESIMSNNGTTIVEINGNLPMIMKVRALKNG